MKKVLGDEHVTRNGVSQDPSHNDVGRDTNRRSSHNDVGRSHSSRKEEKKRAVGYAVAKVWDEIVREKDGMDPFCSVADSAREVTAIYNVVMDDERVEMECLVGNFKPTDEPNNDVFDAVHDGLFGGDWPISIGKKSFSWRLRLPPR